ncbi:Translocase of chloroplast 132, chloroplastic [Linum grandiflorum]
MENEAERVVVVDDDVPGDKSNVVNGDVKEALEERVVAASDELKEEERVVESGGLKDPVEEEDEERKRHASVETGGPEESAGGVKEIETGESKDVEEEVFEEAVDSPEKLPSSGISTELGVGFDVVNDDGNENLGAGSEVETFVEAAGVLAQDVNLESSASNAVDDDKVESSFGGDNIEKTSDGVTGEESGKDGVSEQAPSLEDLASVAVEDKVEVLLGGESIDKIDEGGTCNELETNETIVFSGTSVNGGHEESNGESLVASSDNIIVPPADNDNDILNETLVRAESEKVTILDVVCRDEECGELKHNIAMELKSTASVENNEESCEVKDIAVVLDTEEPAVPVLAVSDAPILEETVVSADISPSSSEKEVIQPSSSTPSQSNGGDIKTVITEALEEKVEAKEIENKPEDKREVETATTHSNGVRSVPPPVHPAGLGSAAPLLEPAQRPVQQHQQQQQQQRVNGTMSNVQSQQVDESSNGEDREEFDETREKLQMIRVKFLRLAHRLGQTPHNVVVAQVLYRLGLAEQLRGRNGGRVGAFSFDRASAMAETVEAAGQEPLDFLCTIMVIGKSGVGKSATINSIFDEVKFETDAFESGTKKVQDVVGTVQGIKVRVIDTPGLLPSWSEQRHNEKILTSVKRFIAKTPPDIVLYLDRLDMQTRDSGDMPLLRTITDIFGPSIWFNAIVVLTHAASAPPEGPNGTVSSYDMFVTQRSHIVQQAIRQAAGDMRLMNPVSLVENHSACRTNRAGQRVLPNGQVWKPHLLLLSFASKILAEANTLLKLQDSPLGKPNAPRSRVPPLPFLLSSLLQSRPPVKLPEDQYGDGDDDLSDDSSSESDEESSEYDELPPFKSLTRNQVSKLTKEQRKAYHEELEYREKLFMKKQLKDERRRRKLMKKMAKDMPAAVYRDNNAAEEDESGGGAASVPVPMPDLALPASFDSDNPTHRYRSLDNSNQWFVRPVLDSHGWDHDIGYDGINVERLLVFKDKIPVSFSGQVTKDKKDANVQMELASSVKHGSKSTSMGFDMQTVGKDLAYTLRGETMLANFKKNKAAAGVSVTLLGDALSAGAKFEDKLIVNKRFRMVVSGGAMAGRGDVAYGGSLEAQLRDKDYPLGRSLSTLGLSVMDWHGDLAIGCNVQSQIPVGRSTNLIARANLNNRGAGQVSLRLNSSEQLQIALVGLLPLLRKLFWMPKQSEYY